MGARPIINYFMLYAINREHFLANEEIVNNLRMFSSVNHSHYTVFTKKVNKQVPRKIWNFQLE